MIEQLLSAERPLLEVRRLSIDFGGQAVLRDISLALPPGQTLVLLGESGCGKTVLLKNMIGLLRPTSGQILFDGVDIHQLSERELTQLRLRYGFVFQNAALFDSLTIAQNVAFPLRQHTALTWPQIRERVLSLLQEVGLPADVVDKRPAELSGGMRKRVGLARALIMNPELMLYDEPTTGLDPIMTDIINQLILRTRSRHPVTSVIVTHSMETARKVPDRVVMLYPLARLGPGESQIVFDGPPEDLDRSRDRRVKQFVHGEAGQRLMELIGEG